MGANAQTTVPTYVASQVLTAQQLNDSARTGVPVFADTTARDAAFGGSGEKTLAEGQLAYIENIAGSAAVQHYDGAAWQTLVSSGLNYITGASFTTATSVSLPTSTFTSTYRNYKVIFQITAVTSDADFTLRFRAAGTDDSTAVYDFAYRNTGSGATGTNVVGASATSITVGEQDSANVRYFLDFDVLAPQIATATGAVGTITYRDKSNAEQFFMCGGGVFRNTTAFDSLTLISSVASSITGVYRVYGYSDS